MISILLVNYAFQSNVPICRNKGSKFLSNLKSKCRFNQFYTLTFLPVQQYLSLQGQAFVSFDDRIYHCQAEFLQG